MGSVSRTVAIDKDSTSWSGFSYRHTNLSHSNKDRTPLEYNRSRFQSTTGNLFNYARTFVNSRDGIYADRAHTVFQSNSIVTCSNGAALNKSRIDLRQVTLESTSLLILIPPLGGTSQSQGVSWTPPKRAYRSCNSLYGPIAQHWLENVSCAWRDHDEIWGGLRTTVMRHRLVSFSPIGGSILFRFCLQCSGISW